MPTAPLSKASIKRLQKLSAIADDQIDYSDIPALSDTELTNMLPVSSMTKDGKRDWYARVQEAMASQPKTAISLRVDPEVLGWFKSLGRGYQTHMNAVLKAYMQTHQ